VLWAVLLIAGLALALVLLFLAVRENPGDLALSTAVAIHAIYDGADTVWPGSR
jgi:hypothetical protein